MFVTFSRMTLVCPVVSIGPADQGMTEFSLCDFKLGQLKRLEHWASMEREAGRSSGAVSVEVQVTARTDRCLPVPRCSQWRVPAVSHDLSFLSYCQRNPGLRRAELSPCNYRACRALGKHRVYTEASFQFMMGRRFQNHFVFHLSSPVLELYMRNNVCRKGWACSQLVVLIHTIADLYLTGKEVYLQTQHGKKASQVLSSCKHSKHLECAWEISFSVNCALLSTKVWYWSPHQCSVSNEVVWY